MPQAPPDPTRLTRARAALDALVNRSAFLGPTLARLTLGLVFATTGWGKLHRLGDVTAFFAELGIPFAALQAPFVAGLELVGGVLLLVGLGVRWVGAPLAVTMAVALLTAKRSEIDGVVALAGLEEWAYLVMLLWLTLHGAGPLSVDALARRARRPRGMASPEPA